jgi:hypothetical protein
MPPRTSPTIAFLSRPAMQWVANLLQFGAGAGVMALESGWVIRLLIAPSLLVGGYNLVRLARGTHPCMRTQVHSGGVTSSVMSPSAGMQTCPGFD